MKKLFLLAALFSCGLAHATDVTLTWIAPTANSDGSVPPWIGFYDIYVASSDAALSALPDYLHGGKPAATTVNGVTTYIFKNVAPGTYYYAVQTRAYPANLPPAVSVQSVHVKATLMAPVVVPGTPTSVTVSASVSAPQ